MAKDKLQIKKYLLVGLKLNIVEILPGLAMIGIFAVSGVEPEAMTLWSGIVLGFSLMAGLYLSGFFVNKWKQWIFK